MTPADLAEYLRVSRATVYKLMKREKRSGFPAVKLGRKWLIDLDQVQNWLVQVLEGRQSRTHRQARKRASAVETQGGNRTPVSAKTARTTKRLRSK
ncbi:MAG: helix-turn-helix domain-containing protein [Candidatus Binataceae bacterium]